MSPSPASVAERSDHHLNLIALAIVLMALHFGAGAAGALVGAPLAGYLAIAGDACALLAVALVLPMMLWKFRNLGPAQRAVYMDPQGFLMSTFMRAQSGSWAATFLLMALLGTFMHRLDWDVPAYFYVHTLLFVMLGVLGVGFFMLSRDTDGD